MGNNLKHLRTTNHLTARQAADIAGITVNTYWLYEREAISPGLKSLIRLADYYHVTLDALVGREPLENLDDMAYSDRMADDDTKAYEQFVRAVDRQGIRCVKSLNEFPFPETVELAYPYNLLYDAIGGYNNDILVRPLTNAQRNALEEVLDSLDPLDKDILTGIYKYRKTQTETAASAGISVSHLQVRRLEALEKLHSPDTVRRITKPRSKVQ